MVTAPDAPASALYVAGEGLSPLGPGSAAGPFESGAAEARYLGSLPFGVEIELTLTVRLHRIVLMPGALVSNPRRPDAWPALIWLEAGNVLTEQSRPALYGAATVNINRQFVGGVRLAPDGQPAYLWDPGATLHNTGSEPAVLWVLTVEAPESAMPS